MLNLRQFEHPIKPAPQLSGLGFRFGRPIIQPLHSVTGRGNRRKDSFPVPHVTAVLNTVSTSRHGAELDQEPAIRQLKVTIDAQHRAKQGQVGERNNFFRREEQVGDGHTIRQKVLEQKLDTATWE